MNAGFLHLRLVCMLAVLFELILPRLACLLSFVLLWLLFVTTGLLGFQRAQIGM
jgi:hypothetical protein